MPIKHVDEYRNPAVSQSLIHRIKQSDRRNIRLMEVCGTHTMSIFHTGRVIMKTCIGGLRIVDMLTGEQLPRIC